MRITQACEQPPHHQTGRNECAVNLFIVGTRGNDQEVWIVGITEIRRKINRILLACRQTGGIEDY